MTESILRVIEFQVDTEVLVKQIELAPVAVIPILHADDGLTEVGQVEQEPLLDLLELPAFDLVGVVLIVVLVAEELIPAAEILGEERVDERHVIVNAPDFEDFLPAQANRFVPFPPRLVVGSARAASRHAGSVRSARFASAPRRLDHPVPPFGHLHEHHRAVPVEPEVDRPG